MKQGGSMGEEDGLKTNTCSAETVKIVKAHPTGSNTILKFLTYSKSDKLLLHVIIKPNASVTKISDHFDIYNDEHLKLEINAPPREGEANKEVACFIAESLKLTKKQGNSYFFVSYSDC
jgi:uncharacterized protein YggU (UPF0235/DUF167 family)